MSFSRKKFGSLKMPKNKNIFLNVKHYCNTGVSVQLQYGELSSVAVILPWDSKFGPCPIP